MVKVKKKKKTEKKKNSNTQTLWVKKKLLRISLWKQLECETSSSIFLDDRGPLEFGLKLPHVGGLHPHWLSSQEGQQVAGDQTPTESNFSVEATV